MKASTFDEGEETDNVWPHPVKLGSILWGCSCSRVLACAQVCAAWQWTLISNSIGHSHRVGMPLCKLNHLSTTLEYGAWFLFYRQKGKLRIRGENVTLIQQLGTEHTQKIRTKRNQRNSSWWWSIHTMSETKTNITKNNREKNKTL